MKKGWALLILGYVTLILLGTLAIQGRSVLEWVYAVVPPGALQEKLVYLLHNHHPVTFSRLLILTDTLFNIGLFLPVGLSLAVFLHTRVSWDIRGVLLFALGIGLVLSGSIELLQAYVPRRIPSLSDVVMNTGGTVFGCYLPYFMKASTQKKSGDGTAGRR